MTPWAVNVKLLSFIAYATEMLSILRRAIKDVPDRHYGIWEGHSLGEKR